MTQPLKPKPHISVTQMESLSRCGEAYRRSYMEQEKIPPKVAMIVGKAGLHMPAEDNFRQKIESHVDYSAEVMRDLAAAHFDNEVKLGGVVFTDEDVGRGTKKVLGEALDEATRLAALHATTQAGDYQPVATEKQFRVVLPKASHDLVGVIDLVDEMDRVVDLKSRKARESQGTADRSLQLTAYSAAHRIEHGTEPFELRLDVLVKTKKPYRQVLQTFRTLADYKALVNRVNVMLNAIKKGVFLPATSGAWWCSDTFCGYWQDCPYRSHGQKPVYDISFDQLTDGEQ